MNPSCNPFVVFGKRPSVFSTKPAGKNSAMLSWPGGGRMTQQEMLLAALNSQGQFMDLLRVYDCDAAEGNVYDEQGGLLVQAFLHLVRHLPRICAQSRILGITAVEKSGGNARAYAAK